MRPTFKPSRLLATVACALAIFAAAPAAEAQPTGDADALFQEGNQAYDASDWALAVKKYGEAFALKPTFDIAANLGAAELKLARFAEAANHLAYAVRNYPPSGDPKKKAGAEKLYGEARQKVGALDIRAPAGAEVIVDTRRAGKAPLADPYFVDPGAHTVEIRGEGRTGIAHTSVLASESSQVTVEYGGATEGPSRPPTGNEGNPDPEGPPLWPGVVLAAVGGVGLGVGVGLFVAGGSASSEADDIAAEIEAGNSSCNPPTGPLGSRCADGEDEQSSAHGLKLGGGIAMGVGGALAVGGIGYFIWASLSGDATTEAMFQPWASPQLAGGSFRSSF